MNPGVDTPARRVAVGGIVGALYVVLSLAVPVASFGLVQFRIGEALKPLVIRYPVVIFAIGAGTARSRTPEIVSDAAYAILVRPSRECSGKLYIDEEVLAEEGVTDLERYRASGEGTELTPDIFLD